MQSSDAWSVARQPGHPVLGALSPSRVGDFTTCPLLYRYRMIDKLPEPTSAAMARGTLVHTVLEDLFDLPAADRVLDSAVGMLPAAWEAVVAAEPELAELPEASTVAHWLRSVEPFLTTYFQMEDPRLLEPAYRELHVEFELPDGPLLRGYVDRVDIAEGVGVRIVDYKTGRAPGAQFEQKAIFQLRFYALVVWRMTGELPRLLQLNYLGSGEFLRFEPDADDLESFERKLRTLWQTMLTTHCPAQGGEILPLPAHAVMDPAGLTVSSGAVDGVG